MSTLFSSLSGVLCDGESLIFTLQRDKGALVVMVQPALPDSGETLSEQAQHLRACLAQPLRLRGDAQDIDAILLRTLEEYGAARRSLSDQLTAQMETLKSSARKATATRTKTTKADDDADEEGDSENIPFKDKPADFFQNPDSL